ncbi:hypothetical protein [Phytoactinopolyspora halotolerans]|uniref:Uncharacterized protein n=1 Tax=Phytoactinopolyspora halotolerans TaxID=1981512 RepID=A0A6L9SIB4_9ACTN|nr:hypothetical protein [Phytoactinopolyspora halotolerans]NEE03800.1 hypothetical protein [Phytoactinopolyspora halotolerans]
MRKPGQGRMRVARGLVMSAACLLLPAGAHVTAGGGLPVHVEFLFAAGLLSVACVALADRRRNPGEIGAALVLSQPALHVLLTMAGGDHGPTVGGASMLGAHVVSAVVLTVLLSGLEAVLWAMAALSSTARLHHLDRLLCQPLADGPSRWTLIPSPRESRGTYAAFVGDAVPWRGPPRVAMPMVSNATG